MGIARHTCHRSLWDLTASLVAADFACCACARREGLSWGVFDTCEILWPCVSFVLRVEKGGTARHRK